MDTQRETTMKIHGSADFVAELFDNWEGMGLISVRFGCHDGEGGISWAGDEAAMDADTAKAIAAALLDMANAKEI